MKRLFKELFEDLQSNYSKRQRQQLFTAFNNNNNIEALCDNTASLFTRYEKLPAAEKIDALFDYLYNQALSLIATITATGDIKDHFKHFLEQCRGNLCPVCSLHELSDGEAEGRNAYDHYLSISCYPLSGVNFYNLVPICHECNTSLKGAKHMIFSDYPADIRRLAFYPYAAQAPQLQFILRREKASSKETWHFDVLPIESGDFDKVAAWDDVFKIKERCATRVVHMHEEWLNEFANIEKLTTEELSISDLKSKVEQWLHKRSRLKSRTRWHVEQTYFRFLIEQADQHYLKSICMWIKQNSLAV